MHPRANTLEKGIGYHLTSHATEGQLSKTGNPVQRIEKYSAIANSIVVRSVDTEAPIQFARYNYRDHALIHTDDQGKFNPTQDGEEVTDGMRTNILFPIKHVLTNPESMAVENAISIKGGHLIPVRWGGGGNYPNVQPWLGAFEDGAWKVLDDKLKAEVEAEEDRPSFQNMKCDVQFDLSIDSLEGKGIHTELVRTLSDAGMGKPELATKFGKLIQGANAVGMIPDSITGTVILDFLPIDPEDRDLDDSGFRKRIRENLNFDGKALHGLDEKKIMDRGRYVATRLRDGGAGGFSFAAPTPHLDD